MFITPILAPANSARVCSVCWLCCEVEFTAYGSKRARGLFRFGAVDVAAVLDGVFPLRILDMLLCWSWETTG